MEINGRLQVTSWQEDELHALDDAAKITRASIGYRVTGGAEGDAVNDLVMYYRPDGTAAIVGLWRVTGSIAGREGSVVFESVGAYDGTTAASKVTVIPGSATGDLATVRGSGSTSATGEQVDYVLDLEF